MTRDHKIETRAMTSAGIDLGRLQLDGVELDQTGADVALRIAEKCHRVGLGLGDTVNVLRAITGSNPNPLQVSAWALLWLGEGEL